MLPVAVCVTGMCVNLSGASEHQAAGKPTSKLIDPSATAPQPPQGANVGRNVLIVGNETVREPDFVAELPQDSRRQIEQAIQAREEAERLALRDLFAERYTQQEMKRRGLTRDALLADERVRSRESFSPQQRGEIARLTRQIDEAERAAMDGVIERRLLEQAAERTGVSVDTLLATELEQKIGPIEPSEIDLIVAYEEQLRGGWRSREELAAQAAKSLRDLRLAQRREELLTSLRAETPVQVLIDSPRASVTPDGDRIRGPRNAPVQIVVFSDFECPFCARIETVLNQVRERYDGKVAVSFRDFPLPMHRSAEAAAEAANCAGMQGKYWEYHDALFADQAHLAPPDLHKRAESLGLDIAFFDACLTTGGTKSKIAQDMEDGAAIGVAGTPAIFVNGRVIEGAPDMEKISRVIDDELRHRGGSGVPASAGSAAGGTEAREGP